MGYATMKAHTKYRAFTLPELLIAAAISVLTASVAGDLLISHLRSSEKAEALERQRSDWARTTSFFEAEIALSEKVFAQAPPFSSTLPVAVPNACSFSDTEVRMELDLRRDLPPIIYAIKESSPGWLADYTLWRCGPSINSSGAYCTLADINTVNSSCYGLPFISVSPVLDGLVGNESQGFGFLAQGQTATNRSSDNKYVSFTLRLKGHASIVYSQQDAARSRISPLYSRPNENSLCGAANMVKLRGSDQVADTNDTLEIPNQNLVGEDILICGYGIGTAANNTAGDNISGSDDANDIIEAGDYGRANLRGMAGNDVIRGTLEADTLSGGSGDDVLIGRDGNDRLDGGTGQNSYLPGAGNDAVIGGSGLDIVFFAGPRANYDLNSGCTKTECEVTASGSSTTDGTDALAGVEIVIFTDARVDLPDP